MNVTNFLCGTFQLSCRNKTEPTIILEDKDKEESNKDEQRGLPDQYESWQSLISNKIYCLS